MGSAATAIITRMVYKSYHHISKRRCKGKYAMIYACIITLLCCTLYLAWLCFQTERARQSADNSALYWMEKTREANNKNYELRRCQKIETNSLAEKHMAANRQLLDKIESMRPKTKRDKKGRFIP
jgi:hypothetical protein